MLSFFSENKKTNKTYFNLYLQASSSPLYASINATILLALYELFTFISSWQGYYVRNLPDVWFRTIFLAFNISYHSSSIIFISFCVSLILFFSATTKQKIIGNYFFCLLLESILWAFLTYFVATVHSVLITSLQTNKFTSIGLAIGAGLFEEFLFRFVLIQILLQVGQWFSLSNISKNFFAVIISALLFSASHYVGNGAYPLSISSFIFRFLAGLWFSALYSLRGFSISAYTHAFYDTLVILSY